MTHLGEVYTGGQGVLKLQDVSITHAPIGVWVDDNGTDGSYGSVDASLEGSVITGGGTGIKVTGPLASVTSHLSRIVGNTTGVDNETGNSMDATNNWWGCNAGPGQPRVRYSGS